MNIEKYHNQEKSVSGVDAWSTNTRTALSLEAREDLLEMFNNIKQIVIEDVPHQYQSRLLNMLDYYTV